MNEAQKEAIRQANAYLSNAGLETYSEVTGTQVPDEEMTVEEEALNALAAAGWIVLHGNSISAEMDHPAGIAADYYELGYPWVNPALEKALKANGLDYDWVNPGELSIFKAEKAPAYSPAKVERKMDPAMIAEMARIEEALKSIQF